ncbi:microtubule integrity protein mal3 [Entomophthora muscae]|uniref:Microtubule integrity protein mal3 n=1 Tax=Entomophthora muscae TaxID=34485 RepID=A0ACC2TXJ6_9FUNG|nr:microtubule integrity protein mal3 [Entomophthora muscae]
MQDNLDFVQWIKRYWEANNPGEPYDPLSRRKAAPGGASAGAKLAGATRTVPTRRPGTATAKSSTHVTSAPSARGAPNNGASSRASQSTSMSAGRPPSASQVLSLQREIDDLSNQLINLNVAHDSISQEREFYYQKLREVEIIIQQHVAADPSLMDSPLVKEVYTSLYSTDEGFELPEEDDLEQLTLPDGMNDMDDIF